MILLGQFGLWAALVLGVWTAVLSFSGVWRDRPEAAAAVRRGPLAILLAVSISAVALWKAIFAHDFSIAYVAHYTTRNLPDYYLFASFWAGQKGSLLFWALVLSIFASLVQSITPARYRDLLPYVAGVTSTVLSFFVIVMVFADANPFERLTSIPPDGAGLNPQLQNPGMVIHPPMLYLGYISMTIPFAFGISALLAGRVDTGWIHAIRKWSLLSWLFLSVGITLGMWWAYVELGWGGYWMWDPVENASLLPWLTTTAFLHSVMIQEKRGMLKRWNMSLVIGSFLLTIFGTFLTRSGVIASVHSFATGSVGPFMLGFLIIAAVVSYTILYVRWPLLEPDAQLGSLASREAAFLFNNLILIGIAFSVLWGTLFPILSEAVTDTKITVGEKFFNQVNVPLGLLLFLLTGIGPLIAWRKTSSANLRRQFLWPCLAGTATAVAVGLAGMRSGYPIVALAIAGFVLGTIVQEFYRGTRARQRLYHETLPFATARLIGRNRRRYGGYLVHLAIVVYFVAFVGSAFKVTKEVTLSVGESTEVQSPYGYRYKLTHLSVSQTQHLNRAVTAATLQVTRNGLDRGPVVSEKRVHFDSFGRPVAEPSTEVGIQSSVREDLYVVYKGSPDFTDRANYVITIHPLVGWVWFGGVLLVIAGLITMWPSQPAVGPASAAVREQPRETEVAVG